MCTKLAAPYAHTSGWPWIRRIDKIRRFNYENSFFNSENIVKSKFVRWRKRHFSASRSLFFSPEHKCARFGGAYVINFF